jgi:hypothetical protein
MKGYRLPRRLGVAALAFLIAFLAVSISRGEDDQLLQLRRQQSAALDALRQRYEAAARQPGANVEALTKQ